MTSMMLCFWLHHSATLTEETARALASDHAESEQKRSSFGEKGERWLRKKSTYNKET